MNCHISPDLEELIPLTKLGLGPLLATIKDPFLVVAPSGKILACNDTAEKILKTPPVPGKPFWHVLSAGMLEEYGEVLDAVIASRQPLRFEPQIGSRWFDLAIEPVLSPEDQVVAVTIYGRDVTAKRAAEARHRATESLLETIIDHLHEWIYWKDQQGHFLGCNRAFAEANGLTSPSDIRGKSNWDFVPAEQAERLRQEDATIPARRARQEAEQTLDLLSGGRAVEKATLPLFTEGGEVIGVLTIAQEVSPSQGQ